MATEVGLHVEDTVQGGHHLINHSSTHPSLSSPRTKTGIQTNKERSTLTVGCLVLCWLTQHTFKEQKAQEQRRAAGQRYRGESIAYLQTHLNGSNTNTVALLCEYLASKMKMSEHVQECTKKT